MSGGVQICQKELQTRRGVSHSPEGVQNSQDSEILACRARAQTADRPANHWLARPSTSEEPSPRGTSCRGSVSAVDCQQHAMRRSRSGVL